MRLTFVETSNFTDIVYKYFINDNKFILFQNSLLENPERGAVMQGCGGLRKIRCNDARRGKGKRGGLRVIYLYIPEAHLILLLDVYDKEEQDNLSYKERKELASIADAYRQEVLKSLRKRG